MKEDRRGELRVEEDKTNRKKELKRRKQRRRGRAVKSIKRRV